MKSGPKVKSPEERFWAAVVKTESGCWLYGGPTFGNKYGNLSLGQGKGQMTTHRFSYQLRNGPIPLGGVICHKCDVKNCVNPDHLYCGTHEDNTKDIVERKRFGKRIYPAIKVKRRRHKCRSLTVEEREQMVAEYKAGTYTQAQLAIRYKITQATVSANVRGWPGRKPDGGKRRTGNFRRKLALDAYDKIRERYSQGATQVELAAEFGIDQTYVSTIIRRRTRKDIADAAEQKPS
jgi:hypothetical protein